MKKIVFWLTAFVFLLKIPATAQSTSIRRWTLSLEAGTSFPGGTFHNTAAPSSGSGYARTGYSAEVSADYRIYQRLGITLAAGFQQNPTATTLLHPDEPTLLGEATPVLSSKHWNIFHLLAGPSWSIPLCPKKGLSLRLRALAGVLKTKVPDVTIFTPGLPSALTPGSTDYYSYGSMRWGFAYQTDVALQWNVTRRLALTLDAGYDGFKQSANYAYAYYFSDLPPYVAANTKPVETGRLSSTVATATLFTRLGVAIGF